MIPLEGEKSGEVMRGLKRFVQMYGGKPHLAEDHTEEITERPNWIQHLDSESKVVEFLGFVNANWSALRLLERKRMASMKMGQGKEKRKKTDSFIERRLSKELDARTEQERSTEQKPKTEQEEEQAEEGEEETVTIPTKP